ncbi:MAG TPA: SDR family oxidoreductase, partial [Verrucomicrobiae bacterium]|nr:SDR family oxidoreductase [Verrucomicrobiae bacterium]
SAGIGRSLAEVFAAHGYNLVLLARGESRLNALSEELTKKYKIQARVLPKDLSIPRAAGEIFAELQKQNVHVSILVNNAGFGLRGTFATGELAIYREMIEVNVTALVELSHLFMKPMIEQGEGRILNVSSTAAYQPGPVMGIYYATKSFVSSFSYALADEIHNTGVTVTTLCPGPTRTEFHQRAGTVGSERIYGFWAMSPESVARIGYRGLMAGKRVVIPGFLNWLGCHLARVAPTRVAAGVARKVIEG